MDQLGLRPLLEELGIGASLRAAAIGSIIARMARPGSERATRRWLGERSALGELLEVDFETMGPMQLYRASDTLMAHREAIESPLFDHALGLFDLHRTITLDDLTNTPFEGEAARQPKAKRGYSKDKRSDCPPARLGPRARRQRLRAPLRSLRRQRTRTPHTGRDARRARCPARGPGGDGPRNRHRGVREVAARECVSLPRRQPETHPPLRPRGGATYRDRVAPRCASTTKSSPTMLKRCACTASPRSARTRSAPSSSASPLASSRP